jgi:hypothetical protein
MGRTRAWRRHQRRRVLAKRRRQFDDWDLEEEHLKRLVDTPHPCSCLGCGNPRKHIGELSVQERRFIDNIDTDYS